MALQLQRDEVKGKQEFGDQRVWRPTRRKGCVRAKGAPTGITSSIPVNCALQWQTSCNAQWPLNRVPLRVRSVISTRFAKCPLHLQPAAAEGAGSFDEIQRAECRCSLGNSGLNQPMRQLGPPHFSGDWEHSEEK
jgi:hypothetical protein